MQSTNENLVTELSRQVVLKVAPEEITIFQRTSEAYLKNPEKIRKSGEDEEDILGFGVGEAVVMMTPIILQISAAVVQYIMALSKESFEEALQEQIEAEVPTLFARFGRLIKKLFGNSETIPAVTVEDLPILNREQLQQVQQFAFEQACKFELSNEEASLLANTLVGRLATGV